MRRCLLGLSFGLAVFPLIATAAERQWQKGTWSEVKVTRPRIVIGLQSGPYGRDGRGPQPAGMTEVRTYVIVTEDLRLEVKEPNPPPRRSVEALVGDLVVFAIEKKNVFVRDSDGTEHRLQLTKREERGRQ
jgi:hypothetical protein